MQIDKNFIVQNGNVLDGDKEALFGDEPVEFIPPSTTMFDILVVSGIFPSKSQARKNWTRTGETIPDGFSSFERIGKLKHRIHIWNPTA